MLQAEPQQTARPDGGDRRGGMSRGGFRGGNRGGARGGFGADRGFARPQE